MSIPNGYAGGSPGDYPNKGGACLLIESSPRFIECRFENCYAIDHGGALAVTTSSYPVFNSCLFTGNAADNGGAVFTGMTIYTSLLSFFDCSFIGNEAIGGGGAIRLNYATAVVQNCHFESNTASEGGAIRPAEGSASISNSTFVFNQASHGSCIELSYGQAALEYCVIVFNYGSTYPVGGDPIQFPVVCCNVYGNEGGDWVNWLAEHFPGDGNISEDPLFCDPDIGDYHLQNDSPCAPDNNDCGVLMGAWPVGCSTSVESRSWGQVKALY